MPSVRQTVREGLASLAEREVQNLHWWRHIPFSLLALGTALVMIMVAWLIVWLTEIPDRSAAEKDRQERRLRDRFR